MLFEQKMAGFSEETGKNLAWKNLFWKEPSMPKDADVEISSPILNSPPTKASTETLWGENSERQPTALQRKQTEPGPQATRPAPLAECQKSNAVQSQAADALFAPWLLQRLCSGLDLLCFCFYFFSAKLVLSIRRIFPEHFSSSCYSSS